MKKCGVNCVYTSSHRYIRPKLVRSRGHNWNLKRAYEQAFNTGSDHCTTLSGMNGSATNTDDLKISVDGEVVKVPKPRRKPKKNKVTQQVVVLQAKGNKKKKRKMKKAVQRSFALSVKARQPMANWTSSVEKQYLLALAEPFHPGARGAKCLVFPAKTTVTYTLSWVGLIKATNNYGYMNSIFVPNPCVYGWSSVDSSATTTISTADGTMSQLSYSAAAGMNGALVDSTITVNPVLSNYMSNFRVVGGGIKFRNALSSNTTQNMFILAPLPLQNPDFTWRGVSGNNGGEAVYTKANTNNFWSNAGIGQAFVESAYFGGPLGNNVNLSALPESRRFTTFEATQAEYGGVFRVVGPDAFEFKDIIETPPQYTNGASSVVFDYDLGNNDGGAMIYSRRGATDVAGWEGYVLKTVAETGTNCLYVDYILHLEGTPSFGLSGQNTALGAAGLQGNMGLHRFIKSAEEVLAVAQSIAPTFVRMFGKSGTLGSLATIMGQSSIRNAQFMIEN